MQSELSVDQAIASASRSGTAAALEALTTDEIARHLPDAGWGLFKLTDHSSTSVVAAAWKKLLAVLSMDFDKLPLSQPSSSSRTAADASAKGRLSPSEFNRLQSEVFSCLVSTLTRLLTFSEAKNLFENALLQRKVKFLTVELHNLVKGGKLHSTSLSGSGRMSGDTPQQSAGSRSAGPFSKYVMEMALISRLLHSLQPSSPQAQPQHQTSANEASFLKDLSGSIIPRLEASLSTLICGLPCASVQNRFLAQILETASELVPQFVSAILSLKGEEISGGAERIAQVAVAEASFHTMLAALKDLPTSSASLASTSDSQVVEWAKSVLLWLPDTSIALDTSSSSESDMNLPSLVAGLSSKLPRNFFLTYPTPAEERKSPPTQLPPSHKWWHVAVRLFSHPAFCDDSANAADGKEQLLAMSFSCLSVTNKITPERCLSALLFIVASATAAGQIQVARDCLSLLHRTLSSRAALVDRWSSELLSEKNRKSGTTLCEISPNYSVEGSGKPSPKSEAPAKTSQFDWTSAFKTIDEFIKNVTLLLQFTVDFLTSGPSGADGHRKDEAGDEWLSSLYFPVWAAWLELPAHSWTQCDLALASIVVGNCGCPAAALGAADSGHSSASTDRASLLPTPVREHLHTVAWEVLREASEPASKSSKDYNRQIEALQLLRALDSPNDLGRTLTPLSEFIATLEQGLLVGNPLYSSTLTSARSLALELVSRAITSQSEIADRHLPILNQFCTKLMTPIGDETIFPLTTASVASFADAVTGRLKSLARVPLLFQMIHVICAKTSLNTCSPSEVAAFGEAVAKLTQHLSDTEITQLLPPTALELVERVLTIDEESVGSEVPVSLLYNPDPSFSWASYSTQAQGAAGRSPHASQERQNGVSRKRARHSDEVRQRMTEVRSALTNLITALKADDSNEGGCRNREDVTSSDDSINEAAGAGGVRSPTSSSPSLNTLEESAHRVLKIISMLQGSTASSSGFRCP